MTQFDLTPFATTGATRVFELTIFAKAFDPNEKRADDGKWSADSSRRSENLHPKMRAAFRAARAYLAENGSANPDELTEVMYDAGAPRARAEALVNHLFDRGLVEADPGNGDALRLHARHADVAAARVAVQAYLSEYGSASPAELIEHLKDAGSGPVAATAIRELHYSGALIREGGQFKLAQPPGDIAKALPLTPFAKARADQPSDAEHLLLEAAVSLCLAHGAGDEGPQAALQALYDLGASPGHVLHVADGFDHTDFAKALLKAWDHTRHPRDDIGRFVSVGAIREAAKDPAKAAQLRKRVTDPEQREKLNAAIRGDTKLSRPTRGERVTHVTARRDEAVALRDKLFRQHQMGHPLDADTLHALVPHLSTMTHEELTNVRTFLNGAGASFGGARRKAERVRRLTEWAKKEALESRMAEQGIEGPDADDMRRAAGLIPTAKGEARPKAAAEPPAEDPAPAPPAGVSYPPLDRHPRGNAMSPSPGSAAVAAVPAADKAAVVRAAGTVPRASADSIPHFADMREHLGWDESRFAHAVVAAARDGLIRAGSDEGYDGRSARHQAAELMLDARDHGREHIALADVTPAGRAFVGNPDAPAPEAPAAPGDDRWTAPAAPDGYDGGLTLEPDEPASPIDRARAAAKAHAVLTAKHKDDFDRYNAMPDDVKKGKPAEIGAAKKAWEQAASRYGENNLATDRAYRKWKDLENGTSAKAKLGAKLDALDPQFAAARAAVAAAHRALAEHNGHEYGVHVAAPGEEPRIVSRHATLAAANAAHTTAEMQELRDASKTRTGVDTADEYGAPGGAWHTRAGDGREVYVGKVPTGGNEAGAK